MIENLKQFKIVQGDFKPITILVDSTQAALITKMCFVSTALELNAEFTKSDYAEDDTLKKYYYEIPATSTNISIGVYTYDIVLVYTEGTTEKTHTYTGLELEIVERENPYNE